LHRGMLIPCLALLDGAEGHCEENGGSAQKGVGAEGGSGRACSGERPGAAGAGLPGGPTLHLLGAAPGGAAHSFTWWLNLTVRS
jgi:hypothetical protein